MNFDWRDISRKDTEEFNQWSNSEDFKIKSKENTIDKYLHTNNYGGLGELIKMFLNVKGKDMFLKVATDNGRMIGIIVAMKLDNQPKNTIECMMFAVNPTLQGKGYGTAMLFDVVKYPEKIFGISNCKFVSYVNKENIASETAFKKAGFKKNENWLENFGLEVKNNQFVYDKTDENLNGENNERKI